MTARRTTRQQTKRARELRKQSTVPERLLWHHLRGHRLGGFHFRRQYPIAAYIVDFACPAVNVVVEVDGMSHVGHGVADSRRTASLEAHGWHVFRFTNDEVLADSIAVAEAILKVVRRRADECPRRPPPDLPQGGGAGTAEI